MKKTYVGYHLDDDNEECQGTQGQVMSDVHANCFTCNQPVPIDETPVFYPMDDIIHLEDMTTEEQETTPALVDWSTCFEVDNISTANKCYTCYEREKLLSYLDDNGMCQIDTCPENRVAV